MIAQITSILKTATNNLKTKIKATPAFISIIVTISDLEDNKFDVSWDKIKDSEFKMFEL